METREQKIERLKRRINKLKHSIKVKEHKIWWSVGYREEMKHYCKQRELITKLKQAEQQLKELEDDK